MNHHLRLIAIATALALVLTALTSTAFAGERRTTGDGKSLNFARNARVLGEVISLRRADGTLGRTWYQCRLPKSPQRGRVTSGVIFPWQEEWHKAKLQGVELCRNTLASPTPRRPTGDSNWRPFQQGSHVLGFAIEVDEGFRGKTFFNCKVLQSDASGRVNSGVVNPSRFELQELQSCNRTEDWRPGFRRETGSGSLRFSAGDWVLGSFVRLDNGQEFYNCRMITPTSGTVFGGVRNYWPGEGENLPNCLS